MKNYADILNISWGGPEYSDYAGFGEVASGGGGAPAAAAPAAGSAPSTAAPTGTGAQPGSQPGTSGNDGGRSASPAGQGGQGATPTPGSQPNPNDANIEVLRQSHQTVQRLGGPEKVTAAVERYTKMYDTSKQLADALGYTPESFESAFAESPADIYTTLMQEAADADGSRNGNRNGNGDRGRGQQEPTLQEVIDRQLSPLRNFATRQMAREANTAVDGEFNRLFSEQSLFKGKQVPAEVKEAIYNQFTDLVKGDAAAQNLILQKGDVSKLLPHFDAAVANMVKFTNSWTKWHTGSPSNDGNQGGQGNEGGQGGRPAAAASPNPFSLDDVIEGNDVATKAMPSLRGFR